MTGLDLLGRTTGARIASAGLGVGIAGLVIQWISDPAKFPSFPPGIAIIAAFGVLAVLAGKWWWGSLPAALVSLWIVGAGIAPLIDNLRSVNTGLVAGSAVMAVGLYGAAAAAIVDAVRRFRQRGGKRLGPVPPAAS